MSSGFQPRYRCPLCVAAFCHIDVLGTHLQTVHGLRHSGFVLARNMWFSPQAFAEVMTVFKDIQEIQNQIHVTRSFLLGQLSREIAVREGGNFKFNPIKHDAETQTENVCDMNLNDEEADDVTYYDDEVEGEGISKYIDSIQESVENVLTERESAMSERRKVLLTKINKLMVLNKEFNTSNVRLQAGRYKLVQMLMNK